MKLSLVICYISVNVMAVVTVFRFEAVSRVMTISSSSSSPSSSKILPVVEAFTFGQGRYQCRNRHHRRSQQQQQQLHPEQSLLLMRAGGLFQGSQDNDNDATSTTIQQINQNQSKLPARSNNDKRLVQDLRKQHLEMSRMMKQKKQQQNANTIPSTIITAMKSSSSEKSSPITISSTTDSSETTTTTTTSVNISTSVRLSSKLLQRYGTSSPLLKVLPKSKKEAADGVVDFLIKYIL